MLHRSSELWTLNVKQGTALSEEAGILPFGLKQSYSTGLPYDVPSRTKQAKWKQKPFCRCDEGVENPEDYARDHDSLGWDRRQARDKNISHFIHISKFQNFLESSGFNHVLHSPMLAKQLATNLILINSKLWLAQLWIRKNSEVCTSHRPNCSHR